MNKTNRLLTIFNTLLAFILVLVVVQFSPSIANAGTTTIVACANEKTGALRIAYKKCTPNENMVTWGKTGPTGPKGSVGARGPAGTSATGDAVGGVVRDATGAVVPGVVSIQLTYGAVNEIFLFKEGGLWKVEGRTGIFRSPQPLVKGYLNPNCTGAIIAPAFDGDVRTNIVLYSEQYDGNNSFIETTYYKVTGLAKPGDVYMGDSNYCVALPDTHKYFQLTAVTIPSDLPAPLYLSPN